jgi:hypothetical protein
MTPLQLETACRRYCHLTKQDADEMVPHGAEPDANGNVPMVLLHSPRWTLYAPKIQQVYLVQECIMFAMLPPKGKSKSKSHG